MTEAELAAAYTPSPAPDLRVFRLGTMTYRPCACGGWIAADERDPGPGMAYHQASPGHQTWRAREAL